MRIPCEVLKQRLQAGIFDNVGEAIIGTWQQDGPKGFFRGTGATLCREVPFYVAGLGLYAESKKVHTASVCNCNLFLSCTHFNFFLIYLVLLEVGKCRIFIGHNNISHLYF